MQAWRPEPNLPAGAYKTYQIKQPKTVQTRIGSCEAAGCEAHERGWVTTVPLLSAQADYIRNRSGRRFREEPGENGLTSFIFYAGQQCFTQHHVTDRPQFFYVKNGDFRRASLLREHRNGTEWVEDFGEHQLKLKEQIEKG